MPFPFTADQQRIWNLFPKPQVRLYSIEATQPKDLFDFLWQMGRVERHIIQVAIESVYDLHMHAGLCMVFTTGKMYGGTSLVCRRWCDYSNKNNLVLHHILQVYALQEMNKAVGINLHPTHPRLYATTVFYSRSGLPYIFMNLPALF